jgi:hypothetical protein
MVLALPQQRTWTVSDLETAALFNSNIRDAVNFCLNPPLFLGYQASAQSVGNLVFTPVAIDTNLIDTYNGHSIVTNNPRYVAQIAGYYRLDLRIAFTGGTGRILLGYGINNTTIVGETISALSSPSSGANFTDEVFLNVGDYVQMIVNQNSGGTLVVNTGAPRGTQMGVTWVHA